MKSRDAHADFPEKLAFLFEPYRYKVLYGGRGSAKSWSVARALLIRGASQARRVLCAREVQKSLKESVHQLLCDQIQSLNIGYYYEVLDAEIRGKRNDSLFVFSGLATHTVDSIKSFEGIDDAWVEEGQGVSKRSWDILTPTIRKPGSEIWCTFNPDLDIDETWTRFVENPPPRSCVVQMNYTDNPWFTPELEEERAHCQRTQSADDYENIWLGKPRKSARGAIYAGEVAAAYEQGRVRPLPRDYALPVFAIWDLGWNDCTSIGIAQRAASELRLIDGIEDSQKRIDEYVAEIERRGYRIAAHYLPHDGTHRNLQTGKSAKEVLEALQPMSRVFVTPNMSIEDGIRAARMVWPRTFIDSEKCADILVALKRYRRAINPRTQEAGAPVHDEYSHAADMFRYLAINADSFDTGMAPGVVGYRGRAAIRG